MAITTVEEENNNTSPGVPTFIFAFIAVFGLMITAIRMATGMGATTALSDGRGWGIWVAFAESSIALAGGAFTIAATVYIFHVKKFYPILRPVVLTGLVCYALAASAVIIDLGFPYRVWHVMIHWNAHSPLFEIAWCVMTYLTVLALEISPILLEKLNLKVPLRLIRSITIPLVILGIILSTMHQSTLGTLFLILPHRVHPLWYSSILPVFFLITAVAAGLSMAIVVLTLCARCLNMPVKFSLLSKIAKADAIVLGIYLLLQIVDLTLSGDWKYLFTSGFASDMFLLEITIGTILPLILFSLPGIRKSRSRLVGTALLVVFGLLMYRFNICLVGFRGDPYAPTWQELAITFGLAALGALVYNLSARYLYVFQHAPHDESSKETEEKAEVGGTPDESPAYAKSDGSLSQESSAD